MKIPKSTNVNALIIRTLNEFGIPANINGYYYLKHALVLSLKDPSLIKYMTKGVYPQVADHYDTTPSRVERSIRHAIEFVFDRLSPEMIEQYFGNCVSPRKGRLSNSEFIATLSEHIRVQLGAFNEEPIEQEGF